MEKTPGIASILPTSSGILPYWLLLTSILSIFNTVACYTSPEFLLRTYSNPFPNLPPSRPDVRSSKKSSPSPDSMALIARLFGVWTLLACILRGYAAYALDRPDIYLLTLSTYIIALCHFTSEWLVYGTISFKEGLPPPFFFASTTTVWMILQWGQY